MYDEDTRKQQLRMNGKSSSNERSTLWSAAERTKWIIAMICGTVLLFATRSAVSICAVAMGQDLSWNKEISGAVMSSFLWGYAATQVFGGWSSDKYGGEVVLGISALGWSLCTLIIPFIPAVNLLVLTSTSGIILARVVTGLTQGVHYPALANILAKQIPLSERTFITSLVFASGPLGSLFAGLVGSPVLEKAGWKSVFIMFSSLALAWASLWRWCLVKPQQRQVKLHDDSIEEQQLIANGSIKISRKEAVVVPWGKLARAPAIWALVITQFCGDTCFWNLFMWLPSYFEENFPGSKGWVFNVLPWLVYFPLSLVLGRVADWMIKTGYSVTFVRKIFQILAMCIPALCMVLVVGTKNFNAAIFLMTMAISATALGNCGSGVLPMDLAPQYAGSVYGIMNGSGVTAGIITVWLTGHILQETKSWTTVFRLNALVVLFGSFVFLIFGNARKIST